MGARGQEIWATRLFRVIMVGLVVLAILVVLAFRDPDHKLPSLQADIAAAIEANPGGTVDVGRIADFEWDRVYAFGPYVSADVVEARLGFGWTPTSPVGRALFGDDLLPTESLCLLVFVKGASDVSGWAILNEGALPPAIFLDPCDGRFARGAAMFTATEISGQLVDPSRPAFELRPKGSAQP